jgi:signal transduction histidine kinase/ActR/RegA family two-component response regulator
VPYLKSPEHMPPSSSGSISALRRWAIAAGIVLVVLIVAADTYEAWEDYGNALEQNERIQLALGRVLSEQAARMVQEVDVVLSDFSAWRASPEGRVADQQAIRERLRSDVGRLPFVYSATLAGADGRVLATTENESTSSRRLAPGEGFTVPEPALKSALYIGQTFIGKHDGARTFALSRRIDDSNTAFEGVVVARVAFEYLTGFYAGVNATPDTSIRLLRDDGTVLAQYPPGNGPIPDDLYVRQVYAGAPPLTERVRYSTSNGQKQVATLRTVEGYPIVIEVARPLNSVLRPWVRSELESAARTLTLVIIAGVLLLALQSALRRHDRMENERRRLEQELQNAYRLEALGFLAASVAHDFNNVLSAIVGYGELASKALPPDAPERGNMDRLLGAAERARLLVRRVLTFNPRRSLTYEPIPIHNVIAEVAQQIEAAAPSSVTVQVSGLQTPATILGDATEIHQVVMNLCTNAVHAMPAGGTLNIDISSVEVQEERQLTIGELHPGAWIRLCIADTGSGLTQEQTAVVFEPFYTTRQPEQGTGIGLTVVRNILARMHGALDVDSEVGIGTRMTAYWPSVVAAPPADVSTDALPPGRGETILIVDDDPDLVALAEEQLASLGYEPVGFTLARAALAAVRRSPNRFDAVVTDERMQSLRGCELAELIHKINPRVPVILVTAFRDAELDERAKVADIAEILDKPLHGQALSAALRRHIAAAND